MTVDALFACPACDGAGETYEPALHRKMLCTACMGTGYEPDGDACPLCGGGLLDTPMEPMIERMGRLASGRAHVCGGDR